MSKKTDDALKQIALCREPTRLHFAASAGDIEKVRALIAWGADVNAGNYLSYDTPLHFAASAGEAKVIPLLIAAGAKAGAEGRFRRTPLGVASENGHLDFVRALIATGAVSHNDLNSSLWRASAEGHVEVVPALIAAKADVNINARTASIYASANSTAALMAASSKGHLDVVQALIAAKADVNARTNSGETALMTAAEKGHVDVMRALIAAKADVNAKDSRGESALYKAVQEASFNVVGWISPEWKAACHLFLSSNGYVNAKTCDGDTPLKCAMRKLKNHWNEEVIIKAMINSLPLFERMWCRFRRPNPYHNQKPS